LVGSAADILTRPIPPLRAKGPAPCPQRPHQYWTRTLQRTGQSSLREFSPSSGALVPNSQPVALDCCRTDAAVSVLRVDSIIVSKASGIAPPVSCTPAALAAECS
jgi:hypothetical protein